MEVRFEGHGSDAIRGFLAMPGGEAAEPWPGVILAHAAGGPEPDERAFAGRLAAEGFAVLLVDLCSREGARTPDASRAPCTAELPDRRALSDLDGGARWLGEREDVDARSIAVLGFGRGGTLAFLAGCTSSRFSCVVDYCGGPLYPELSEKRPTQPIELHLNLDRPLLAFFGERDQHVPAEHVRLLRERLDMAGKDFEIVTYEGAEHGFFDDGCERHDPRAAADAWRRTLAFLRENP